MRAGNKHQPSACPALPEAARLVGRDAAQLRGIWLRHDVIEEYGPDLMSKWNEKGAQRALVTGGACSKLDLQARKPMNEGGAKEG